MELDAKHEMTALTSRDVRNLLNNRRGAHTGAQERFFDALFPGELDAVDLRVQGWKDRLAARLTGSVLSGWDRRAMTMLGEVMAKQHRGMDDGEFIAAVDRMVLSGEWPGPNGPTAPAKKPKARRYQPGAGNGKTKWMRVKRWNYDLYGEYMRSDEWNKVRQACLERDGRACMICSATHNLCAHHRNYDRLGYERLSDLTTLCWSCHRHAHDRLGPMVPWVPERPHRQYDDLL